MPRRPPSDDRLLQKVVRLGLLMDAYGALLTDKQREFMRLHYEEDLSFGEIAKDFKVSRQAIHDAVKHAERSLEDYEARLGLLAKGHRGDGDGQHEAIEVLENTLRRLRKAGVIYSSDWIIADIKRVLNLLGSEESKEIAESLEESADV